jgi:coenzyme PQQ precursor peptide PqqA
VSGRRRTSREVRAIESMEWETPELEEFGCAPEVTMYVARLD